MARRLPNSKSLDRKAGSQSPKWKIVIICEGEITEPRYFRDFERNTKNQLVEIDIIEKGGAVRTLVGKVKAKQEELAKIAKKSGNSFDHLFRVWGVPDVDEHPKLLEARNLAKQHNLNIALSNPCFELWALLHFGEQDAPISRKQAQRNLAKVMPSYNHDRNPVFDFSLLRERHSTAVANAVRGRENRDREGAEAGNPSCNVDQLMEEIRCGPKLEPSKGSVPPKGGRDI